MQADTPASGSSWPVNPMPSSHRLCCNALSRWVNLGSTAQMPRQKGVSVYPLCASRPSAHLLRQWLCFELSPVTDGLVMYAITSSLHETSAVLLSTGGI